MVARLTCMIEAVNFIPSINPITMSPNLNNAAVRLSVTKMSVTPGAPYGQHRQREMERDGEK